MVRRRVLALSAATTLLALPVVTSAAVLPPHRELLPVCRNQVRPLRDPALASVSRPLPASVGLLATVAASRLRWPAARVRQSPWLAEPIVSARCWPTGRQSRQTSVPRARCCSRAVSRASREYSGPRVVSCPNVQCAAGHAGRQTQRMPVGVGGDGPRL